MSICHFLPLNRQGAITLTGRTVLMVSIDPADATAAIRYGSDGAVSIPAGTPSPSVGADEWLRAALQGAGAGNPYEIIARYVTGDPLTAGDAVDVWLALSSARYWEQQKTSGIGERSTSLDVSIRRAGQTFEYGPARVVLTAAVET